MRWCYFERGVRYRASEFGYGMQQCVAEGDPRLSRHPGVSKEVPVGFQQMRLQFDLDTRCERRATGYPDSPDRTVYCVVYQTLSRPAKIDVEYRLRSG